MNNAFNAQELSDEQLEMVVGGRGRGNLAVTLTNVQLNVAVAPQVNVLLFNSHFGATINGPTIDQRNSAGQGVLAIQ